MSKLNPILAGSAQSIDAYQQAIAQTSQAVAQWLQQPEMYQGKSVDELRERITLDFNEQGLGNQAAIERAIEYFLKDSLSVHHPQCVAHLHCPSLVISQAAEVLINATNQSMDSWDQSPSATIIEIKLIEWLRAQVGYGAGDAGVFHQRRHPEQHDGPDAGARCLLRPPGSLRSSRMVCRAIFVSTKCCVQKTPTSRCRRNMALMGLGYRSVTLGENRPISRGWTWRDLKGENRRGAGLTASRLWRSSADRRAPPTRGAIDPLREIAAVAAEHQIWLHVDAAWGGALLMSEKYRDRLDGIELVDSITLDFHKQFFQTISCGAFLLKEAAPL
jgi:L-2,4-diaminobutyrate decarboxylase